jgi:hypothetical protein
MHIVVFGSLLFVCNQIMQPNDIIYYLPPDMAPPTISLDLPKGKLMRTIVDRMMKISRHLHIDAEQTGRLVFRVENSSVSVKTYYTGLSPRFGELRGYIPSIIFLLYICCDIRNYKTSTMRYA